MVDQSNNFPSTTQERYDSLDPNTNDTDRFGHLNGMDHYPTLKLLWDYDQAYTNVDCYEQGQFQYDKDKRIIVLHGPTDKEQQRNFNERLNR